MNRTWTENGKRYYEGENEEREDELGQRITQRRIERAITELEWQDTPVELAFSPGEAIKAVVRDFEMPFPRAVAVSNELAPLGLYGIQSRYSNGLVRVYVIDAGSTLTPVASDHWPIEKEEAV